MQRSPEFAERIVAESLFARQAVLEERIREKIADYDHYKFTVRQARALNIFFDLAQEYEDPTYLYHLPVQLLQFFFKVKAELYARNEAGVFTVQTPKVGPDAVLPGMDILSRSPCVAPPGSPWYFFSVRGRPGNFSGTHRAGIHRAGAHRGRAAAQVMAEAEPPRVEQREILAVMAILPDNALTGHDKLFYEKFANRLGFSLHNRMLAVKNLEHIEFVRTLVHDIGHNVIVPNLHFKLLMRQMESKIAALKQLSESAKTLGEESGASMQDLCCKIEAHYEEINKHFHQSSFFLETLLRQSHFDQGRYVLQRTRFAVVPRVVSAQFERYRLRFLEREITAEERSFKGAEKVFVDGDVGLLSQVMANFLSNAVKYTRVPGSASEGAPGKTPGKAPGKAPCDARGMAAGAAAAAGTRADAKELKVRCCTSIEKNHFGPGLDGVKIAVCSTGDAIPENEAALLFSENFRASNADGEQGSGHGLYFSRLIVSQHGGECGYERDGLWNVFFMILPVEKP